eukprot:scaffold516_cov175-Amphora_coffeaeformis.AAC.10
MMLAHHACAASDGRTSCLVPTGVRDPKGPYLYPKFKRPAPRRESGRGRRQTPDFGSCDESEGRDGAERTDLDPPQRMTIWGVIGWTAREGDVWRSQSKGLLPLRIGNLVAIAESHGLSSSIGIRGNGAVFLPLETWASLEHEYE